MYISREDEGNFPNFNNVDETRDYFVARYGELYNFGYSEIIDGMRIYFDDAGGQPVGIWEDGCVHVVY
ncbi:hypothetical protein ABIA69_004530 [Lysinibacillus parviboronicapiens]|uniref:Uncharacterized protein n=1 Tax=Lysinibacillus parviboronicapiens TaxID=436516 RepID=A0ABV2PQV1_9BACI